MPARGLLAPGVRLIRFDLDARTALDVYFALAASKHCEETTLQQRTVVAGLLPSLKRELVRLNVVSQRMLDDYDRHLLSKPCPPPLDAVIRGLKADA